MMNLVLAILYVVLSAIQQNKSVANNPTTNLIEIFGLILLTIIIFIFFWRRTKRLESRKNYSNQIISNQTLIELSRKASSVHLNFHEFIEELLFTGRLILECNRASFWEMNQDGVMICKKLINKDKVIDHVNSDLDSKFLPDMSDESIRIFSIDDIKDHPYYEDGLKEYINKQNIKSAICAPLHIKNELKGVVCFTTDKYYKKWTDEDKRLSSSVANIAVTAVSVTEKEILSQEKEELIKALKTKNKKLTEFNSALSHNVREPLTQIIGFSGILNEIVSDSKDTTTKEVVKKIKEASEKTDKVIKELTDIIVQQDINSSEFEPVDVENLVEIAIENLDPLIQKKSPLIARTFNVREFISYEPFLYDIILELLKNSLKFNCPNRFLEINISTDETPNHYILAFKDNGRGIDMKKYQSKIFKMYERIHLDVEGRGLGLYMVDARVMALEGSIEIDSNLNEGTSIIIRLNKL